MPDIRSLLSPNSDYCYRSRILFCCLLFCVLAGNSVHANEARESYIGVFRSGDGANGLYRFDRWQKLVDKWKQMNQSGQKLVSIDVEADNDRIRYHGVFRKGQGANGLYRADDWNQFIKTWKEWSKDGQRLVSIDLEVIAGKPVYFGVFRSGQGRHALYQAKTWAAFVDKWNSLTGNGQRLISFDVEVVNGTPHYVGVCRAGGGKHALYRFEKWSPLTSKWRELKQDGMRLLSIDEQVIDGKAYYFAAFGKRSGRESLIKTSSWSEFTSRRTSMLEAGKKLTELSVHRIPAVTKPARDPRFLRFSENTKLHPAIGLRFPEDMPAVRYPKKYKGCDAGEKLIIKRAWAMATYMVWRADQAMDWLKDNGRYRESVWNFGHDPSRNESSNRSSMENFMNYAPRSWFGPYNADRFKTADNGIEELRRRILNKTFTVKCRVYDDNKGAHPCYRTNPGTGRNPSANHLVYGTINFCNSYFKRNGDRVHALPADLDNGMIYRDADGVVHELLHWLRLRDGHLVGDTHTHCHGNGKCSTEKMYGWEKARHLVNYDGGNRGTKAGQRRRGRDHRAKGLRNNDNYAAFVYWLGRLAYGVRTLGQGQMTTYPPYDYRFSVTAKPPSE